jgi:hypothetical protein
MTPTHFADTSPEPFSNIVVSLGEDAPVVSGLWAAIVHPLAFIVILGLFVAFPAWFLPRVFRRLRAPWSGLFGRRHAKQ